MKRNNSDKNNSDIRNSEKSNLDNRRRKSVSEISTCPDQGTKNREHFKIELPFYSFSNQFKFGFVY